MSDIMKQIAFLDLMDQAMRDYQTKQTLFGVPVAPILKIRNWVPIFGKIMETPIGPAAGPHTQLAQNIIAGYGAGGRFFELKTVQVLWGEQLGIKRPCIYIRDEGYNTEWSTELSPKQAAEEYIKAWIVLKLLAREYDLGDPDRFIFNMSVGYDLEGIQSPSVDEFIETMKDASSSEIWKKCIREAKTLPFTVVDEEYIDQISPQVSNNITVSTMHGCPPSQIQAIGEYMLTKKHLHTYIKCNPTLIGYEKARALLDGLGYKDLSFGREHFEHDMKLDEAIPMLTKLLGLGEEQDLQFGVKLTNTFPVHIVNGELEGSDMYMSGKALYPLSIHTAAILEEAFEGRLPISYSGGADENNVEHIFSTGIYPITVATVLLKKGGYKNLSKMMEKVSDLKPDFYTLDACYISNLAELSVDDESLKRREQKIITGVPQPFACGKCNLCVDVCPNRANYIIPGLERKAIHLDGPCNDCGNCASMCPFGYSPYKDKFILFPDEQTMSESDRDGFVIQEDGYIVRYQHELVKDTALLPGEVREVMDAVKKMDLRQ